MNVTPIFSGGSGRSGTTIIINLLDKHESFKASLPREIRFLTDRLGLLDLNYVRPYPFELSIKHILTRSALMTLQVTKSGKRGLFLSRMQDYWWSTEGKNGKSRGLVQGIDKEGLVRILEEFSKTPKSELEKASSQLFFDIANSQVIEPKVRYFGDSTPANITNSLYIKQLLPTSKFINMTRDGRDVAYSISKQPWGPNNPMDCLELWKKRLLSGANALEKIDKDSWIEIRIEDLVQHKREETYTRLSNYLELSESIKMKDFFNSTVNAENMHSGDWQLAIPSPRQFNARYSEILKELSDKGINFTQYY